MSIGTIVNHPIDMISAYGMIANNGVLMPRHTILKVVDHEGKQVWPPANTKISGERVVSRQAAYIMTDILAGNTIRSVNPFWGEWRITDGVTGSKVRPAAYKTGTTSDNKDVHAYGYLAPPKDKKLPALVAGIWMGNSDNTPNDGKLSLDTSAPAVVGPPVGRVQGHADRALQPASSPRASSRGTVDAFTGLKPSGSTRRTVDELFIDGTEPAKAGERVHGRRHRRRERPPLAGGLRRPDGHQGVHGLLEDRGRTEELGRRPISRGRPARAAAPASRAARSARARPTSTAAGSTRSAGAGAAAARRRARSARSPRRSPRRASRTSSTPACRPTARTATATAGRTGQRRTAAKSRPRSRSARRARGGGR